MTWRLTVLRVENKLLNFSNKMTKTLIHKKSELEKKIREIVEVKRRTRTITERL